MSDSLLTLLIGALPPLLATAYLLFLPAALPSQNRAQAAVTVLALMLLSFIASLALIRYNTHSDAVNTSRWIAASLAMLGAGITAAPLLDRARTGGLVIAASIVGIFLIPAVLHGLLPKLPAIGGGALLYTVVIASSLIGLGGSFQLPLHPSRFTPAKIRRVVTVQPALLLAGWMLFALVLLTYASAMTAPDTVLPLEPVLTSALVAAFMALVYARSHDGLRKAGEGFVAGILLTALTPLSIEASALLGLVGGYAVSRSEAVTDALALDDPHHLTGTVLFPALLGITVVDDFNRLSDHLIWAAVAILLGVAGTLLIWPLTRLTLGFARPNHLLK